MSSIETDTMLLPESTLGKPPSWWVALPAVIVGGAATLTAMFGFLLLPSQLPGRYAAAYDEAVNRYEALATQPRPSPAELIESAGELDVIYSRLVSLERSNDKRYWQWYEFLTAHTNRLQIQLDDPAASLQDEARQNLESQADTFRSKARELVEQLAAGNSAYQMQATLEIVTQDFSQGLGHGARSAERLAEQLVPLVRGANPLRPSQLEEARLLFVRLQMEAAWYADQSSPLLCDQSKLNQARQSFEEYADMTNAGTQLRWSALSTMLQALASSERQAMAVGIGKPISRSVDSASNPLWDDLAELELAACAGDWTQVGYLLSGKVDSENSPLFAATARTICRLVCSPMAQRDEVWLARSSQGLQLAAQLAPYLPEFAELLWLCSHPSPTVGTTSEIAAKTTPDARNDPPLNDFIATQAIVQAIAEGQSGLLKHTLFALTAALEDKPEVAKTHMELIRRGGANLQLLANVALWRSQQPPDPAENPSDLRLVRLLEDAVQLEPESGVNWLALGALRFRSGEAPAALEALETSRKLLGDLPAIKNLLDAAQKAANQSQ